MKKSFYKTRKALSNISWSFLLLLIFCVVECKKATYTISPTNQNNYNPNQSNETTNIEGGKENTELLFDKFNSLTHTLIYKASREIIKDRKAGKKFEVLKYAKLFDSVFSAIGKTQFNSDSLYMDKKMDKLLTDLFVNSHSYETTELNKEVLNASKQFNDAQARHNFLFFAALLKTGVDFIEHEENFLNENLPLFTHSDGMYFFQISFLDRVKCRIGRIKTYITSEKNCRRCGHDNPAHIKGGVVGAFFNGLFEGGNLCSEENLQSSQSMDSPEVGILQ